MLRCVPVLAILMGAAWLARAQESVAGDESYLKSAGLATDSAGLASYLRQHTLTDESRQRVDKLIQQLRSDQAAEREEAVRQLVALGRPAVPSLREASRQADPAFAARALNCLQQIDRGPGLNRLAAAVRLLVQRPSPDAVPLLLDLYPHAGDDWVEEEVLTGLGKLAVPGGKVHALLLVALQDASPRRRAPAACVVARHAGGDFRGTVRRLLDDPDPAVRRHVVHGLLGDRYPRTAETAAAEDELFLKNAGVPLEAAGLADFFRKRTLFDQDLKRMEALVRQLGSEQFQEREDASRKLVEAGAAVLGLLRDAARSTDLEVIRRVESCITEITRSPGPALPAAALRALARRSDVQALRALLDFIPFADDAYVEDEALTAIAILSLRQTKLDESLLAALQDGNPRRRAAAAWTLAQVGDKEHIARVLPLLADADAGVRFRAAQGLLLAQERAAVPVLIALLGDGPMELANQAEMLLHGIAAEGAPGAALSAETRNQARDAWAAWWKVQGPRLDLSALRGERHLGLTLVAELTGTNAGGNRVAELGRDGRPRWELTGLAAPIDAQMLRGGRVLVAEHNASRVSERDLKGNILWQKMVQGNPVACQRLANGNTFIATYSNVMEVTPDGKEIYNHNPNAAAGGVIYDARKMQNGNIVCVSGRGTLIELDTAGKQLRTIQVSNQGGWAGVTPLPGGRFLVALLSPGKVIEIDGAGKTVWEAAVPTAAHAVRLASGNTLVACMNTQRIVEINPAGSVVWEQKTAGRPFHVRRR